MTFYVIITSPLEPMIVLKFFARETNLEENINTTPNLEV